jgi:hypothetical protein
MVIPLSEYRVKLINKILFSGSQQDVECLVNDAKNVLQNNKVNEYIMIWFIEEIIEDLERFSPMKKDAQQWSNITIAKILFNRIKYTLKELVH